MSNRYPFIHISIYSQTLLIIYPLIFPSLHASTHPLTQIIQVPPSKNAECPLQDSPWVSEALSLSAWLTLSTQPGSLAVQEVHDGLQHVVGVLGHTTTGTGWHIACALHLAKDVTHLLDTLLDVWLEAGDREGLLRPDSPGCWWKVWIRLQMLTYEP